MEYKDIYPTLDEMFGAEPGTAEESIRERLERGPSRNKLKSVVKTEGDWSVKKINDTTASVVRQVGGGFCKRFSAMITISTGRGLPDSMKGLPASFFAGPDGNIDPEKISNLTREQIRFHVIR